jgi:HEAT repeat protein/cyclophilin family peptidyl-prolyl cis-trans isomerase
MNRAYRLIGRLVGRLAGIAALLAVMMSAQLHAQAKRPLSAQDIADITTLLQLEDTRDFNAETLGRIVRAQHPEVRRRAAQAIARINDQRGRPLLHMARDDRDTSVVATAIFGLGQLRDSAAVPMLGDLLSGASTPVTVAAEAARSLGKIRTSEARDILARYLTSARESDRTRPVIGEALFAIGRNPARGEIAPIIPFTKSRNEEIRWRATWALFRPRDPAAVPELLRLSRDESGHVRSWAVRALSAPQVDTSGIGRDAAVKQLIASTRDSDRRVRTEAIRALIAYEDSASFDVLVAALDSDDSWISVSAAEALARRANRSADAIAALTRSANSSQPSALRIVSVQSLLALSPESARTPAELLGLDTLPLSKQVAAQIAARLNPPPPNPNAPRPGGGPRPPQQRPINTGRSEADYRAIVERWVVPAYNGAPRPRVEWLTPKGAIELELYPGEAPLAVENFMSLLAANAVVGTEFSRVVPDFVDQQRTIQGAQLLRDEVTRLGLTRGNLSWASAGLDTGRPGYTLGSTPQPHNEGDFTTLGRVVRGIDVVDRIELGDRIVASRILR